jgi:hypothetical protein
MAEQDALSDAKFGSNLFLKDFPVKIRVLTRDPMVYNDNYANTKYAFVVYNLEDDQVQILDKTGGFAKRFQEINADEDFGGDLRKINIKITTNDLSGKEIRYTLTPVGTPSDLTEEQKKIIKDSKIDLDKVIKKKNPGAIRLSEVNQGKKPGPAAGENEGDDEEDVKPSKDVAPEDVVIEDIGDEPINLDDIPF